MMHKDSRSSTTYRFGFDIGGTFTDFVLIDSVSGHIATYKTLTTPHNPAEAVMEGWYKQLEEVGTDGGQMRWVKRCVTIFTIS
jgi:N-methylhydantoinase A/oxoprolinase/acetone carboxylase beta subunit